MRAKLTASAVLIAGIVVSSSTAFTADSQRGATIARRWCSSCHVVASNQRQITGEAPPFATIAQTPGFDEHRLAFFLLDPHPKMPDMGLSRTDAADLAAYIASQGK